MGGSYPTAVRRNAGDFRSPRVSTPANDNAPYGPRYPTREYPRPANDNWRSPKIPTTWEVFEAFADANAVYRWGKNFYKLYDLYRRLYEMTDQFAFTTAGWTRVCGPVWFATDNFIDPCSNWPSYPWYAPLGTALDCGRDGQSFGGVVADPWTIVNDGVSTNMLSAQKRLDGVLCLGGDYAVNSVWTRNLTDVVGVPGWVRPDIPMYPQDLEGLDPFRFTRPQQSTWPAAPLYKPADKRRYDPDLVEQSDRGYDYPGSSFDYVPDVNTSSGRPIGRQPPRAREKEKKVKAEGLTKYTLHALIMAAKVNGKMRDFKDYVDAFWKNIPKKHRTPKCKSFGCKLADIWKHWDEIDGSKAFRDMIKEIAEDVVGGAAEQLRDEAAKKNGWFKYKVFLNPRF